MLTLDTSIRKPPCQSQPLVPHVGCVCKQTLQNVPRPWMGAQKLARTVSKKIPNLFMNSQQEFRHTWMSCCHSQPSSGVPKITCLPGTRTDPSQSSLPAFPVCISRPVYIQLTTTVNPFPLIRHCPISAECSQPAVTAQVH